MATIALNEPSGMIAERVDDAEVHDDGARQDVDANQLARADVELPPSRFSPKCFLQVRATVRARHHQSAALASIS